MDTKPASPDGTTGAAADTAADTAADDSITTPPPTADVHREPLRRSSHHAVILGVCAGLAKYLGVPVAAVRIIAVLLAPTLIVPIAYLAAGCALPDGDGRRLAATSEFGAAVMIAGLSLAMMASLGPHVRGGMVLRAVPWVLGIGGWALIRRGSVQPQAESEGGRAGRWFLAGALVTAALWSFGPYLNAELLVAGLPWAIAALGAGIMYRAPRRQVGLGADHLADTETSPLGEPRPLGPVRPPQPRSPLGPVTLLIVAAVSTALWAVGVSAGIIMSVAILAMGLALALGTFRGRARALVLPAAAVGLLAAPSVAAGVRIDDLAALNIKARATATKLPPDIHAGFGTAYIDLLDFESPQNVNATYEIGTGTITVMLPAGMRTRVIVDAALIDLYRPLIPSGTTPAELAPLDLLARFVDEVRADRLADRESIDKAIQVPLDSYGGLAIDGAPPIGFTWVGEGVRHLRRTFDPPKEAGALSGAKPTTAGDPLLTLRIRGAVTEIHLIEPIWEMDTTISEARPIQQCIMAGDDAAGRVKPCSEVPTGSRVPTCLLEPVPVNRLISADGKLRAQALMTASKVADCRVLAAASDRQVLLACTDNVSYSACTQWGIDDTSDVAIIERPAGVPSPNPPGTAAPTTVPPIPTSTTVPPIGATMTTKAPR